MTRRDAITGAGDRAGGAPQRENPFSTSRVRPGALAYHFPPGINAAALVERFGAAGWRGEIIGPHGSGKSTLLADLMAELARCGRPALLAALHDRQRRMPAGFYRQSGLLAPAVVVVDGYEQLSWWSRKRIAWACRRRGLGLLVTAHRPTGLPTLYRTHCDPNRLYGLVCQLLEPGEAFLSAEEVGARLDRHGGNVRELFMDLYDEFEARRD